MSAKPWYPFYWSDYAGKAMHLTQGEHGAYFLLLRYIFTSCKPIPEKLTFSVAKANEPHERSNVETVLSQFFRLTDEGWVQDRAFEIIQQQNELHEKRVNNGKKGGRGNKGSSYEPPEKAESSAKAELKLSQSNQNQNQNQILPNGNIPPKGGVGGGDPPPGDKFKAKPKAKTPIADEMAETAQAFEELLALWPRRDSKKEAHIKLTKLLKEGISYDDIYAGAQRYHEWFPRTGKEPTFAPHLVTWLNQHRWGDELPDPTPKRRGGSGAAAVLFGED